MSWDLGTPLVWCLLGAGQCCHITKAWARTMGTKAQTRTMGTKAHTRTIGTIEFSLCCDITKAHWVEQWTWIPWNLSFSYIHCSGQFTPKMKANAEPRLLSSLVWIDSGTVVSQHCLKSFFHEIECNRMTSFMESMSSRYPSPVYSLSGYRSRVSS